MTTRDHLFLIVFHRATGASSVEDLGHDVSGAMEVFRARERLAELDPDQEVVLLGSASLESLKRTHSSYFGAAEALRPAFAS